MSPCVLHAIALSAHGTPTGMPQERGDVLATTTASMSPYDITPSAADAPAPDELENRVAGTPRHFMRLPETAPAASTLAAGFCGGYRSEDFGCDVEIVEREDLLFLDFLPVCGEARWALHPLSSEVLLCGELKSFPPLPIPAPAVLLLDYDNGRVTGFWQNAERIRNLHSVRC